MGNKRQIILVLVVVALMAALVAGCGGGSSDSSSGSSSSTASADSSGEASTQFVRPGKKNEIATFGEESNTAEREAASSVLEENLQAREVGDWAAQCSSLSAAAIREVEKKASVLSGKGCANALESLAQPIAKSKPLRTNTMSGPVAALRVKGNKAFALYHGTNKVDYVMPLSKEGGEWKVASLVTQPIP
jgi:hypothetical protein